MAKQKGPTAAEPAVPGQAEPDGSVPAVVRDGASITSSDGDGTVRMRFMNPAEEKISGSMGCGTDHYPKRPDGTYVVKREHIAIMRENGLEVCG